MRVTNVRGLILVSVGTVLVGCGSMNRFNANRKSSIKSEVSKTKPCRLIVPKNLDSLEKAPPAAILINCNEDILETKEPNGWIKNDEKVSSAVLVVHFNDSTKDTQDIKWDSPDFSVLDLHKIKKFENKSLLKILEAKGTKADEIHMITTETVELKAGTKLYTQDSANEVAFEIGEPK